MLAVVVAIELYSALLYKVAANSTVGRLALCRYQSSTAVHRVARSFLVAPVAWPSAAVGAGKYDDLLGKHVVDQGERESPENTASKATRRFRLQESES